MIKPRLFEERGTILIVVTLTVVLLSAISASIMLQIQSDTNYTQFTKHRSVVESLLKGAVHESLKKLNDTRVDGHLGVTFWDPGPTNDVGLDGVAGTGDYGEGDGFPTFAPLGSGQPGEPGGSWVEVEIDDGAGLNFKAYYTVYDENFGTNGIDDDNNDPGDGTLTDDISEAGYHRLRAVAFYAGESKRVSVVVGSSNATDTTSVSETFFKAIYAGNSSEDPNYFLDMGGQGKTGDAVKGDVFITGNIRLSNASFMWKTEGYDDANGNGIYDFGETVNDIKGQEPGFLNLGTEGTGDINIRSTISSLGDKPTIGGSPAFYKDNSEPLDPPQFQDSLDAVTINVLDELNSKGTATTFENKDGLVINDANNPAHIFMKVNDNQLSEVQSYYNDDYSDNGLSNFIIQEPTIPYSSQNNKYKLRIPASGNNQVYQIDGNLMFGSIKAVSMYFVPLGDPNDPIRVTFIVRGNVVFNDDFAYRDHTGGMANNYYDINFGHSKWNPYDDAFAMIALENPDATGESGNILFADGDPNGGGGGGTTFERMDGFLYAENDFRSVYGTIDKHNRGVKINGMMAAGNHVRINQDYYNPPGEWRARPDADRNRYIINFDTRIRELMNDANWLPGLPGGSNRSMPVVSDPSNFTFDTILSWNEY